MTMQTTINGEPVWFVVCALNDCASRLLGPYFDRANAEREAAYDDCSNAHFIVPTAIAWMPIAKNFTDRILEMVTWVAEHNRLAALHPNYREPEYDDGGVAEERFATAIGGPQ